MAKLSIVAGATSQSVNIFIQNSTSTTGAGLTGLAYNTASLIAYYTFTGANCAAVAITLATLAAVGSAYSSGGFKEIDSTHMPGLYRLDIPNAALAASSGQSVALYLSGAANMAPCVLEIELTGWNNQDGVHGGMSCLPNTAVTTNASLLTSGTGTDQLSVATGRVNLGKILDTAVSTPATAGILDINVKNMNNVAATSITTINANQGTPQPLNFTGTAGSALVKSDVTDIAGSAVSASTAQLGVNVVNIAGTASAGAAGYMAPDWGHINAPTTTVDLSGTTIKNLDGNTVQTGDSYARLGAPAGASVSADIAAVEVNALAAKNSTAGLTFTVANKVDANTLDLAGQTVTAAAGVTFPSSVASPTNITGGTITTVTNITNAPANGDLTSTMKSSVTTACNSATTVGISSNRKKAVSATFDFTMTNSTTGVDQTGLTVASVISKDGAAFGATANSVTETGGGWYQLVVSSGEMTANNIGLQMTATGAVTRDISIQTQP